ncbi:Cyclic di-GMP phosphodiesterase Gmr [Thalassocella blandensis]|nr:Cyclic di-GMP phosphodiesterase Gmr [Thalassocella blandensis]
MSVDLKALFPKLINLMLDTVFVVDKDNYIVFVSDACESLLGYKAEQMVGTLITDYMHPDDLEITIASIARIMNGQSHTDFRNRYLHKNGSVVHILWSARWSEEDGVRIGVARDVTALRAAEDKLHFLALHDPLTGLANRSLFSDRLDSALRAAHRHQTRLALLFLDLNDFKYINDTFGHATGDRVLCTIAQRLEHCVRETDTVARMGGDEFIILLTDLQADEAVSGRGPQAVELSVQKKVQQIATVMSEPLGMALHGLAPPSCSIGIAYYPEDGEDSDTLLSHADKDMYRLKEKSKRVG